MSFFRLRGFWLFVVFVFLIAAFPLAGAAKLLAANDCKTFLVAPLYGAENHHSMSASRYWLNQHRVKFNPCDQFLLPPASSRVLENLAFAKKIQAQRQLSVEEARRLQKNSTITHLITFRYFSEANYLYLQPEIVSLVKLEQVYEDYPMSSEYKKSNDKSSLLSSFFSNWMPNSIEGGVRRSLFFNRRVEDGDVELLSQEEATVLPSLISSLRLQSIAHPRSFSRWDMGLEFNLGLRLQHFDFDYQLKKENQEPQDWNLRGFWFLPGLSLTLNLKSPLGLSFLSFFAGVGLAQVTANNADEEVSSQGVFELGAYGLGHRLFVFEDIYVQVGMERQRFPNIVRNGYFKIDRSDSFSIAVGYYFFSFS